MKTIVDSLFSVARGRASRNSTYGGGYIRKMAAACCALAMLGTASAGVFDDAKFKLDLRGGDPNGNAFVDSGEVFNALNSAQTAVLGGGQGASTIAAANYASNGYDKYGELPYVADISVVNPANGSTYTQKGLVLPQSSKAVSGGTQWSENGIVFTQGAVQPGADGCVTIYARYKWEGNTSSPNHLVGNGWDGVYGNTDNGVSVYLDGEGKIGILKHGNMGSSAAKSTKNVWHDVFVTTHNETINGTEQGVSDIYLYKANTSGTPTLSTSSYTNSTMVFATAKTRVSIGSYLTASSGWATKTNPRAFKGQIADVMIWDRALTEAEMAEVMAGTGSLGGEWQIGAANGSADEFSDTDPAAIYDVQSMPWRMMRKTLDASHPSLSLSTAMTSREHQRARTLGFTPILSGTGASVPVEVALNGTAVGEIDLASETSITIPRKFWRHDGAANTIAVTRKAPVSGTVQFDAISLAPAAVQPAGSVLEDATFKLDLRGGESTFTQPGDLGNVFDFSSASPVVGWMGDQRGPQHYNANFGYLTAQETAQVRNPYYPLVTKEQTVLHFYQDNPEATDEATGVRSGVVFPGLAPQSDVQTFYLRFRWDGAVQGTTPYPVYLLQSGNADNGNSAYGVAVFMETPTVSEDGTTTNVLVKCRIGQANGTKNFLDSGLSVSSGTWNDLFVTFAKNDGEDKCTTTWSLCQTPAASGSGFEKAVLSKKSVVSASHPQFNSSNLTIGTYHNSGSVADSTRCFRGLVADFMLWERALTDDEKRQVMNGSSGAKWFVGLPNGSADEFGDASPAATYEPETMPWRQMRKTLDASNPTLSLRCTVAGNDVNAAKLLSVSPILRDGAEVSCPVAVSVNGTSIGTYDFADPKKRCILVERALWAPDASGKATVTLARTGTISGTLAIDHLSLSGTWMIGNDDGRTSPMPNQTAIESSRGFVGDTEESRFCSAVSVGANRASIFLDAWLPDGAEAYDWRFATDIHSNYQTADLGFSLFVNGTQVGAEWPLPAGNNANEKNVWNIPAGTLVSGVNHLQLKMTTPASGTGWAFLDYYRLQLVEPPKAFVLVIR